MFFLPNKWSIVKTSVGSKLYLNSLLNGKEKQVDAAIQLLPSNSYEILKILYLMDFSTYWLTN